MAVGFVAALVGGLGRFQERQCVVEALPASVKVMLGLGKRLLDLMAFSADGVDLGPELFLGPALDSGQVKKIVLLVVECVKTLSVLLAEHQ